MQVHRVQREIPVRQARQAHRDRKEKQVRLARWGQPDLRVNRFRHQTGEGDRVGKGGGRAHTPVEAKDNLKSTQMMSVIDAIGEGPIEGPVKGLHG